jgi:hypothetical protein
MYEIKYVCNVGLCGKVHRLGYECVYATILHFMQQTEAYELHVHISTH